MGLTSMPFAITLSASKIVSHYACICLLVVSALSSLQRHAYLIGGLKKVPVKEIAFIFKTLISSAWWIGKFSAVPTSVPS